MSKFRQSGKKETPAVSTASLPDIVFMLLFFFMVTTTIRDVSLLVKMKLPTATELTKLEKKSLVSYIYVGPPMPQYTKFFGTEPRIQLNDQFAKVSDIPDYILAERAARDEAEIPFMVTSLKVDELTKMQIVGDIKQELRKAAALHINYSSRKAVEQE
ncbi:MAG: biopolymer transporter ExbD [Prolixibacteraceae bacterium]|nr:biopolymer transporter ExbD [Prolixibacteraceae bacterium]